MVFKNEPIDSTSAELEELALGKFRELTVIVPKKCQIFRQIDAGVVTLYLDFIACPKELATTMKNSGLLAIVSHQLGLADSLVFRIGSQLLGWTNITKDD